MAMMRLLKINRRYVSSACCWCGDALVLGEDGAICEACESPHHARCWARENGCNGDPSCVNRPLHQIADLPQAGTPQRTLKPNENVCPSCGDVVTGFCFRCRQLSSGGEYTGAKETSQEAKEALKYALVGLLCCGVVLGPLAFWKGVQAKQEIARDPSLEGSGIATVAQVLGALELLLSIFFIIGRLAS
jgi:hypothetical protein